MAKKTKDTDTNVKKPANAAGFFSALKKETGAESFKESKYTAVEEFISTGSLALNRICSGSINGGIPAGCLTLISGDSSTGKSLFAANIAANAIKQGYNAIIYVDSEGGGNRGMFENSGVDTSMVQYIPVSSVEECTIKLIQTYKTIAKYQKETDPDFKALLILDSLGGLVSEKVLLDADKDKNAADMGGHAKKCLHGSTLVLMGNGTYKQIRNIEIGDAVCTIQGNIKRVCDKIKTNHEVIVEFTIDGEDHPITCSKNHLFPVYRKKSEEIQWVKAEDILISDKLIKGVNQGNGFNQVKIPIKRISIKCQPTTLYDITVEDDHTFLITNTNIFTHNCGTMLRAVTIPAKKTNSALLILSQQYADPNALFPSKLKNIRGGQSAIYQPSLIVQLSRRLEKGNEKEDNFYETSIIKAFTIKTRNNVRPFLETEISLSFKNGFRDTEYYGLIPEAIRLGFIKNEKVGWYTVPSFGEKQLRNAELIGGPKAKAIWDTFIEEFDKISSKDISYGSLSSNSEFEEQLRAEMSKKFNVEFNADTDDPDDKELLLG